jgi:UDP-N-acetylmuramoylalanine--D-glutamate ligase
LTRGKRDGLDILEGAKVLVIGLGISGRSAAAFCAARGARVLAVDERPRDAFPDADALEGLSSRIELRLGQPFPELADFDLVVPSPGVPQARYAGAKRAWGDIELAGRALRVPVVAVTGTNGKSTTVRLVEAMLRAGGLRARAAGNIGAPALDLVGEALDAAVLEVSSFQLEAVDALRPAVAVILNVSPDHLDRHGSLEGYVDAKARLLARQEPEDSAVLNLDDPIVASLAERTRARVVGFSRRAAVAQGAWFDAGRIVVNLGGLHAEIALDRLPASLSGVHNLENLLAAFAAVAALGADPRRASTALIDFEGLPHRCQTVAESGGVLFVDDSKATNPGAAERSLESFVADPRRVLWIAGGRGKGTAFAGLADAAVAAARHAFLIGESAAAIEAALAGRIPCTACACLEDAVQAAAAVAHAGDVVLLAPGCASFDQFRNFEDRGERFAAAARREARGASRKEDE